MSKYVVTENCTLQCADGNASATFTFASKAKADGGKIAIGQVVISVSGSSVGGAAGNASGSATLMASATKTKCDSQYVVLEGDEVDVPCSGTMSPIPIPTGGPVNVKIVSAGQSKVKGT